MIDFNALNEITLELKNDIKENIESDIFSLWFDSMDVLRITDLIIAVSVPTDVKKIKIESKYKNMISETVNRLYDLNVKVIVYSTQDGRIAKERIDADEKTLIVGDLTGLSGTENPADNLQFGGKNANNMNNAAENSLNGANAVNNTTDFYLIGETKRTFTLEYTFDNFVVGSSNRLAYKACTVVAQYPAVKYNPFFIYGPSGLGKTHLLYAIAAEYAWRFKSAKVLYTSGEEFTNLFINSLSEQNAQQKQQYLQYFRERFRNCDMILIDDIQFLEKKVSTQEEFFHMFNALYAAGKQIIITSDRPPKSISTLEDRLRSRFESGLIVDIQPPDLELRIAILKRKSADMDIDITNEVLFFLAENISSNIRQMEGAIKKLNAYSLLNNSGITLELAKTCIADILSGTEPINVTVEKVISLVSQAFSVPQEELKGRKRTKEISFARNVAVCIIRRITDLSLPKIGKIFARDHATIHSAINSIEEEEKINSVLSNQIEEIAKLAKN
jgi:chromosomal replication initiator protein